jgi:mannosyltransferase
VLVAREAPPRADTTRLGSFVSVHARAIVVALTVLAGLLGFLRLGYRAVNHDESITIDYARGSWLSLWHTVAGADPNMSLYYGLVKLWTSAAGDSVLAVRSISVLAATLCIPVVYAIGTRLFGTSAGLLAALLVATNVFFLRYAQEARGYALVTLLTAIATYVFLVELEQSRGWSRVAYVVSATLAFYVHFFAVWVVLIHVLTLVAARRRQALRRSWLVCYAAIAALVAPMVYVVLALGNDPIGWVAKPDAGAIPATFAQLAGDSFLHLGVVVAVSVVALRWAVGSTLAFGIAFTASWAVIPVIGTFAVSEVKPIFLARYLIVCLPAVALLASGAITSLRPTVAAIAAAFVLVALSGPELRTWYGFRGLEDWRTLTTYVQDRTRSTDGVIYNARYAEDSVTDYWRSPEAPLPETRAGASGASAPARVWLVLAHSQSTTNSLRAALLERYRLESKQGFDGDIAVELYSRRRS